MNITFPLMLGKKRIAQITIDVNYADDIANDAPVEISLTVDDNLQRMENMPITTVFREMAQTADIQLLLDRLIPPPPPRKVFLAYSDSDRKVVRKLKASVNHELAHWLFGKEG